MESRHFQVREWNWEIVYYAEKLKPGKTNVICSLLFLDPSPEFLDIVCIF